MDNGCLAAIANMFGIQPASCFAQKSDAPQGEEYLNVLQQIYNLGTEDESCGSIVCFFQSPRYGSRLKVIMSKPSKMWCQNK